MAAKKTEPVQALTNFDIWKQSLTPEFIASHKFIVLACGACPAYGKTCGKYDTTCRGNFLSWARAKYEAGEAAECGT
jgi:hypothetical protein